MRQDESLVQIYQCRFGYQFSESQHGVKLIIDLSADRRYMFIKLKCEVNVQVKNIDLVFNMKGESIIGVSNDQSLMFTLVDNHPISILPLICCLTTSSHKHSSHAVCVTTHKGS